MFENWESQIVEAMNVYDEAEEVESRYNEIFHDLENEKAPELETGANTN